MRLVYDLIVPANTLEADPVSESRKLVQGKITRVQIRFLRGCHNQVSVVMRDGLTRIIPAADSEVLIGDGQIFDVPMNYRLNESSPEIIMEGWSPGTDYDHTITWYIDLLPDSGDERSVIEQLFFQAARIE
jgi:hypothetical protein